jgi:hypothetical protein
VYDDLGNLRFVIPPRAVEYLTGHGWAFDGGTWATSNVAKRLCFSYEYDDENRMSVKRVPDAGEVWMVYDIRDRIAMTQDENLRPLNKWLCTVYDDLNRTVKTGFFTDATHGQDRISQQGQAGAQQHYPGTSSNFEVLTETYYDDYLWITSDISSEGNTYHHEHK